MTVSRAQVSPEATHRIVTNERAAWRDESPKSDAMFAPGAQRGHADCVAQRPLSGQTGKHVLALSFSDFDPEADIRSERPVSAGAALYRVVSRGRLPAYFALGKSLSLMSR